MKPIHNLPTFNGRHRTGVEAAFNMIETVLAVAVVGLGVVAILGLVPVGTNAARQVSDETIISGLAGDMMHWRRITPYDNPTFMPYNVYLTQFASTYGPPDYIRTNVTSYFDANGYLPTFSYTNAANPFYTGPYSRFKYTVRDHPQFPGYTNAAQVVITVDWPLNPGTSNPVAIAQQRVFVSQYTKSP